MSTYWHDRPIRICPTPWCGCRHREAGADERCAACRRRPVNAEAPHGFTLVKLRSSDDAWAGEFGTCYSSWLAPESCERARADRLLCESIAAKLNRDECRAFIKSCGVEPWGKSVKDLRQRAALEQYRLWWPMQFVN